MRKHIAWRLALIIPTLLAASVVIFVVMRALPGDVALVILGGSGDTVVNPEVREALEEELGLNDPLVVQYGRWLWSMVSGEFGGRSLETREPIRSIVGRQLPVTALLTGYTILLSVVVSLPLGVLAAARSNRLSDYVVRLMTLGGLAIPSLWVALLTILCLLIFFRWSPPLVYAAPWSDPWVHLQKMVWPAAILAWEQSSHLVRVTRSSVLEALNQTYITTARGKGLPERSIVLQHALPNALVPAVTMMAFSLAPSSAARSSWRPSSDCPASAGGWCRRPSPATTPSSRASRPCWCSCPWLSTLWWTPSTGLSTLAPRPDHETK